MVFGIYHPTLPFLGSDCVVAMVIIDLILKYFAINIHIVAEQRCCMSQNLETLVVMVMID